MKGSILGGRSLFITGTDKKGKSVTRQGRLYVLRIFSFHLTVYRVICR